jgi:uncharacterized protein involved in exopolysaccharide biosynthesis
VSDETSFGEPVHPQANSPAPRGPAPDEPGQIINFRAIYNWLRFGLNAGVRRKKVLFGVTAVTVTLAFLVLQFVPRKYEIQCRVLTKRSQVLSTRMDGQDAPDPTRSAGETILATENLVSLVEQTDLVHQWQKRRTGAQKLKDRITGLWSTPPTDAELKKSLADYLKTKMQVWSSEGTITMTLYWPDGEMGYRLMDAAQRSFLETRHVQEVSTFGEQVSILEGHSAGLAQAVDVAVQKLQALREKKKQERLGPAQKDGKPELATRPKPAEAATAAMTAAFPQEMAVASKERERRLAELPALIEARQQLVDDLDGERRRRIVELETKLEKERGVLTDAHPEVVDLREAISVAATPSPQAAQVRQEIKDLKAEQTRLLGGAANGAGKGGSDYRPRRPSALALGAALSREEESSPEVEFAREELNFAIEKYQDNQDAIRRTRIELDTSAAAFKYRYTVVTPPERPRGPISPKAPLILIGALIAGLGIGLLAAFGLELREGLLRQAWQVEHLLDIPVLGEVELQLAGKDS